MVSFEKFRTFAFNREVLSYCRIKIVDFTAVIKKMGECKKSISNFRNDIQNLISQLLDVTQKSIFHWQT